MSGIVAERPIAESGAAKEIIDAKQEGVADARKKREAEQKVADEKLKVIAEARLAELPGDIKVTESKITELKANLARAEADAEKPGKTQGILLNIVKDIKGELAVHEAELDRLNGEEFFYQDSLKKINRNQDQISEEQ